VRAGDDEVVAAQVELLDGHGHQWQVFAKVLVRTGQALEENKRRQLIERDAGIGAGVDAAREALLTLSAILECVDGAALTRAHDAMARARAEHTARVAIAHKLPLRYVSPTPCTDDTDDKE
jgi:hypothetical protein